MIGGGEVAGCEDTRCGARGALARGVVGLEAWVSDFVGGLVCGHDYRETVCEMGEAWGLT